VKKKNRESERERKEKTHQDGEERAQQEDTLEERNVRDFMEKSGIKNDERTECTHCGIFL